MVIVLFSLSEMLKIYIKSKKLRNNDSRIIILKIKLKKDTLPSIFFFKNFTQYATERHV